MGVNAQVWQKFDAIGLICIKASQPRLMKQRPFFGTIWGQQGWTKDVAATRLLRACSRFDGGPLHGQTPITDKRS